MMLSRIEYQERIRANDLFNSVPAREFPLTPEDDHIEGRLGGIMLTNRLPWLQREQNRPPVSVDMQSFGVSPFRIEVQVIQRLMISFWFPCIITKFSSADSNGPVQAARREQLELCPDFHFIQYPGLRHLLSASCGFCLHLLGDISNSSLRKGISNKSHQIGGQYSYTLESITALRIILWLIPLVERCKSFAQCIEGRLDPVSQMKLVEDIATWVRTVVLQ